MRIAPSRILLLDDFKAIARNTPKGRALIWAAGLHSGPYQERGASCAQKNGRHFGDRFGLFGLLLLAYERGWAAS